MILSDSAILQAIEKNEIVIEPFERKCLGSNSYDVHLSENFAVYAGFTSLVYGEDDKAVNMGMDKNYMNNFPLNAKENNPVFHFKISEEGFILRPGILYLASTVEYTETHGYVPFIDGKSSTGRLGISIHVTAGRGDSGFKGHFTLEISVVQPVKVFPGMPIGQLIYHTIQGEVLQPYSAKPTAKYNNTDPKPIASQMYKNFE